MLQLKQKSFYNQYDNQYGVAHIFVLLLVFVSIALGVLYLSKKIPADFLSKYIPSTNEDNTYTNLGGRYNPSNIDNPSDSDVKELLDEVNKNTLNNKENSKITKNGIVTGDTKVFYLSDGNIWTFDITDNVTTTPEIYFDHKTDITQFSFSPDKKMLAFLANEHNYQDTIQEFFYQTDVADTAYLYNIESKELVYLKEIDPNNDDYFKQIIYSNDGGYLFLLSNKFEMASTKDYKFSTKQERERTQFCSTYYVGDFSPNGDLLYFSLGCHEGSYSYIVNINDFKELYKFRNYTGGGEGFITFLDNESFLVQNLQYTDDGPSIFLEVVHLYYDNRKRIDLYDLEDVSYFRILSTDTEKILFSDFELNEFYRFDIATETVEMLDFDNDVFGFGYRNSEEYFGNLNFNESKDYIKIEPNPTNYIFGSDIVIWAVTRPL